MKPAIDVEPFFRSNNVTADLMSVKLYQSKDRNLVIQIKDRLRVSMEHTKGFLSYFLLLITLIRTAYLLKKTAGTATKENTIHTTTHLLLDMRDGFWKHHHNPGRDTMLRAAWDMLVVVSTDPYYEWLLRWQMWEVVKAYESGNLPELGEPLAILKACWK